MIRPLALLLLFTAGPCWPAAGQDGPKPAAPAASPLQTDADGMVKLAADLQAAVRKSNEHTLSLQVVRKAEDIERLAKKMKAESK